MEELLRNWLFDPVVGKLIAAVLAVAVVFTIVRYSQRVLGAPAFEVASIPPLEIELPNAK